MAKLVKLTSNIDLDLPASKFDLRSWKVWSGTYIYFWFRAFWCIERWIRLKNGQVSEIDLDLVTSVFDLQSWNMLRGTHIYNIFWVFWRIKRWNRLRNGQVSEIDLQYWPRPPRKKYRKGIFSTFGRIRIRVSTKRIRNPDFQTRLRL